jgi:hypothetical protein
VIVTVQWRDITFEEALECVRPEFRAKPTSSTYEAKKAGHNARIGSRLQIYTTPVTGSSVWLCKGPFYETVDGDGCVVCPHHALIGD